jgi:hypothetical protein
VGRGSAFARCCVVVGGVVAASVGAQASSGGADDTAIPGRIIPGIGVDHLHLGMTEGAAKRVLRRVGAPGVARRVPRDGGQEYVELRFPRDITKDDPYVIGTQGTRSSRVVVLISVNTWLNKTPKGIRIGDRLRKLVRAYPGANCRPTPAPHQTDEFGTGLFCTLGDRSKRNTVFLLKWYWEHGGKIARVTRIDIREPFVKLDVESHA